MTFTVLFNLIVFRPSISEVIEGKIQSQSEKGLKSKSKYAYGLNVIELEHSHSGLL